MGSSVLNVPLFSRWERDRPGVSGNRFEGVRTLGTGDGVVPGGYRRLGRRSGRPSLPSTVLTPCGNWHYFVGKEIS